MGLMEGMEALQTISKIDAELDRLRAEEKKFQEKLSRGEVLLKKKMAEVESLLKQVKDMEHHLLVKRTAVKDMEQKILQAEKKQSFVTKAKEAEALSHELQKLADAKDTEELEVMTLEEEISPLKAKLEEVQKGRLELAEQGEKDKKEIGDKLNVIAGLIERTEVQRGPALDVLDKKIRAVYERLRATHHQNPLVEMTSGLCGGCQLPLLPNVVVQVNSGRLVNCPECGRFLIKPAE